MDRLVGSPASEAALGGVASHASHAVRGAIPASTVRIGVLVADRDVELVVVTEAISESELEALEGARARLADLLGSAVYVELTVAVGRMATEPTDGPVRWFHPSPGCGGT